MKQGSAYTVRWKKDDGKTMQVLSFAKLKDALTCVRERYPKKELRLRKTSQVKQVSGSDVITSKKKQKYRFICWHTAANAWFVQKKKQVPLFGTGEFKGNWSPKKDIKKETSL